jgi:hypothetical protein
MRERHISQLWADEALNQVCWDDIGSRTGNRQYHMAPSKWEE